MSYNRIVISSGHGKYVRGASGILDEVDEARRVVERVADELRDRDVEVKVFHDDISDSQNENLNRSSIITMRRRATSMSACISTPMSRSRSRWAPRCCT